MPYHYEESTKLSRENAVAIKSLAATGELPHDHYWNALRAKHDANPSRFDRGNYVIAALLDRDQLQRQGVLTASSPLFPNGGFFSYAGAKHALNVTRFDHWHPFLGRLFEIKLPTTQAGEGLTTTPVISGTPVTTTTGTIGSGGTTTGGGTPLTSVSQLRPAQGTGSSGAGTTPIAPAAVPEPASILMLTVALGVAAAGMALARLVRRGWPLVGQPTAA